MTLTMTELAAHPSRLQGLHPVERAPFTRIFGSAVPAESRTAVSRVLLVDGLPGFRAGVAQLLHANGEVEIVGATGHGDDAVRLATILQPDVVLLDVDLIDGPLCIKGIVAASPSTRVVALTGSQDPERILAALRAGATSYLSKDASGTDLAEAVRTTIADGAPLNAPVAPTALLRGSGQPTYDRVPRGSTVAQVADEDARDAPEGGKLTNRETQVLTLLAKGCSNKVLADTLCISEATVKAHLTKIFRSIGVLDRTQAALWAYRQGYGDPLTTK
jgi:DNA-binding NarL/FixJ family response regulator